MAASLVGHKDQLIDLKMFFVGYPVCVISVAILLAIVERCIILYSLRLCCALQKNIFYPPGHIKAQAFFKLGLLVF